MLENGGDLTDWERVRAMPQEEVERLAHEEDGPLPEGWEQTVQTGGVAFVDDDILAWFRATATGPGWEARLNGVLRAHVEAQSPG
jgi:uncharacterized protein (DUF4415 family)